MVIFLLIFRAHISKVLQGPQWNLASLPVRCLLPEGVFGLDIRKKPFNPKCSKTNREIGGSQIGSCVLAVV